MAKEKKPSAKHSAKKVVAGKKDTVTLKGVSTQEVITKIVGDYHILKQIGRGGMSVVSLALDGESNQLRAIKVVEKTSKDQEKNDVIVHSAISEAKTLKGLDNEYLPKIYNIIETEELIYVVMEYIEGKSLKEVVQKEGAQNEGDVIRWGSQLCRALGYLHAGNPPIIFRDMKPSNIMLKLDGNIKLIDFGIAREYKSESSKDTVSLGTRGYAAPEQFDTDIQSDERTDIFNLGVTLYHLVTGKDPSKPPYVMKPIRHWDPGLSIELERIIAKATNPEPDLRYQCAMDMYDDIQDIYSDDETSVLVDTDETASLEAYEAESESNDDAAPPKKSWFQKNIGRKWWKIIIPVILVIAVGIALYVVLSPNPYVVKDITASVSENNDVIISWTALELDMPEAEILYSVLGSEEAEGEFTKKYEGEKNSFTDSKLLPETKYFYKVCVLVKRDGKIFGGESGIVSATTDALKIVAPKLKVKDKTHKSASLSWKSVKIPRGKIAYHLLRSQKKSGKYKEVYKGGKTSFSNSGIKSKTKYFYKLVVTCKIGDKEYKGESNIVSVVTKAKPVSAPAPAPRQPPPSRRATQPTTVWE